MDYLLLHLIARDSHAAIQIMFGDYRIDATKSVRLLRYFSTYNLREYHLQTDHNITLHCNE